ncbi:hypothetical protein QBC34DRAFT_126375 [Podospora aff. communis PSN243]|uniref:MARVEL domain-containing protein n=1 Tax=Podospora aff. communis PSN243 TaxID=3040156 RepID=A0AAV9GI66_9PEZI|nr:hypothetical protein QBC34DRAFT_126375 [Podospora aff. communis PSN243]
MILFETTESVVEILWDVALAFFISRLALIYFLLNFVSALALSYLVFSAQTPVTHLVTWQNPEMLLPFLLGSAALWARLLIVRYEIPRSGPFRLGIGAVALALMVFVEAVVAWVGYEEGWWVGGKGSGCRIWSVAGPWLAWYALLPFGMMFLERREEAEAAVRAVPEVREKN